ncbi:MAG TPA: hypothetical protein VK003_01495 [Oceanobacillus sp.]|nr:hypothetical protein [Oceanobacillus sp.]
MARIWKEKLDLERHRDYMRYPFARGSHRNAIPKAPPDKLIEKWVYFVDVCSFTFQFHSIEQIQECLDYFSQKPIPSSGKSGGKQLEPYWRAWHERLPMWLKEEPKRQKVVKALERALTEFAS